MIKNAARQGSRVVIQPQNCSKKMCSKREPCPQSRSTTGPSGVDRELDRKINKRQNEYKSLNCKEFKGIEGAEVIFAPYLIKIYPFLPLRVRIIKR